MKFPALVGTLVFLAIVNIVAVDTYLYYKFVHQADVASPVAPGAAVARTGVDGAVSKLDAAQRKEIRRIKNEYRNETDRIYSRIKELEDEMYHLVQEDPVSQARIERNLSEHGDLRLKLKRIALAKMIETRSILTPAQKEELFRGIFRSTPRLTGMVGRADSLGGLPRTDTAGPR